MTATLEMVQKIQDAYREGKTKITDTQIEERDRIHLQALDQWTYAFSPTEKAVTALLGEFLRQILQATRQGELAKAAELVDATESLITSGHLSPDVHDVCKSYLRAATAYLDYKQQWYNEAVEHVREALILDAGVEERNPAMAYILHMHRMMLLNNWVRVFARCRRYDEAISLGFQILDYLEGKSTTIDAPTSWDAAKLVAYPTEALSLMFKAATAEILDAVTGMAWLADPTQAACIRDLFVTHARQHAEQCHLSVPAHQWIGMKLALLDNDSIRFFDLASTILAEGPGSWPALWYATVVEVIGADQLWDAHCDAFVREVAQDAPSWKRVPSGWRAILERAAAH